MSPLFMLPAPPVMNTVSPTTNRAMPLTRMTAIFAISQGNAYLPAGVLSNEISSASASFLSNGVAVGQEPMH